MITQMPVSGVKVILPDALLSKFLKEFNSLKETTTDCIKTVEAKCNKQGFTAINLIAVNEVDLSRVRRMISEFTIREQDN